MGRLAGKVAIVTGGGTGIGAATAKLFAAEGAKVLVVGRREEPLIETVKEIGGEHASYTVADVSKVEDTDRYVADAANRYGGVDILVSNAGTEGPIRLVHEHSVSDFDDVIATNIRGVWLSYRAVLPELIRRGGGTVVLMSSIAGHASFPTLSAYVASKHAVVGLAKSFALEGAPVGIRVNAVCPGFIDTRMFDNLTVSVAPLLGVPQDAVLEMLRERAPLKRFCDPAEIAALCLFLAGPESSYVTGSSYVADGGVLAGIM